MHENPEDSSAKMRCKRILCASRSVLLCAARMAVNSNNFPYLFFQNESGKIRENRKSIWCRQDSNAVEFCQIKGKQVKILYDLVTVNRECSVRYATGYTGKAAVHEDL